MPYFGASNAATGWLRRAGKKSVRMVLCVLLGVCAQHLAGCATTPAGIQNDGTYLLESQEKKLDCQGLYKSIWGRIELMKKLPARAKSELQAAPPTLFSAWGRMFSGPNKGLSAVAEYDRDRAHVEALHAAMTAKGCVSVELDRELLPIAAAMAEYRKQ